MRIELTVLAALLIPFGAVLLMPRLRNSLATAAVFAIAISAIWTWQSRIMGSAYYNDSPGDPFVLLALLAAAGGVAAGLFIRLLTAAFLHLSRRRPKAGTVSFATHTTPPPADPRSDDRGHPLGSTRRDAKLAGRS